MCDVNHRSLRKMGDKIFQLEENRFLNGAGGGEQMRQNPYNNQYGRGGGEGEQTRQNHIIIIFFHVSFSKTSFNNKLNYGDIHLERKVVVKHRALLS